MKDLEFHVDRPDKTTFITHKFDEAAGLAISIACSTGQSVNIDIIAWSSAAARAWAGNEGVKSYEEDHEASVFDRISIQAESLGRIA